MSSPPVRLAPPTSDDPFLSPGHASSGPHRYASFDNNQLVSLYNSSSPSQAKRALEAHMKDTDRRIQEASRLGQSLLKQRKELNERLKDIEHEKDENEIGPELQKKLSELEKEYTQVGRESVRNFLPKNRIQSGDFGPGSPSVFSSEARASPSKVSAPSRRQRNQPTNRVHDIEFATEISTSLLAQVRQLQAVLAEKEDALRTTTAEKAQLEADIAGLVHRLKVLDESEQKCKEENWNLETQLQEIQSSLKDLTEKEQRLNHILKTTQAEKDAAQRELEDLKHAHGKLAEDHEHIQKQHDSDLHTLRRDVANHESQRDTLQKKIEELTSQNTELARAVASHWHNGQSTNNRELAATNEDAMNGQFTPEDSPPPSPSKTPARNGQLESETLRSSLTHAHRMIQNLKNNIHREKTEKLELKRMLQDARDEVEKLRTEGAGPVSKKRRPDTANSKNKQPLRPEKLGATRSSTHEIIMDDDDWEDQEEVSPSRVAAASRKTSAAFDHAAFAEPDSTDAFETANEREGTTTESDAFLTGVETIGPESSDDLTETESTVRVKDHAGRPSIIGRPSYQSTASTDDEEDFDRVRTPVQQQHPKLRLRNVRGRRSGRTSELFSDASLPAVNDSPAGSFHSDDQSTPVPRGGQNLMAELEGLSDEDTTEEETDVETPNRLSLENDTPGRASVESSRTIPDDETSALGQATPAQAVKPQMVDSSMMTEPWEPETKSVVSAAAGAVGGALAGVAGYALGRSSSNDKEAQKSVDPESSSLAKPEDIHTSVVTQDASGDVEPKSLMGDVQRANMSTPRAPLQRLTETVSQQTRPVSPTPTTPQRVLSPQFAISTTSTAAETEPVSPARPALAAPFAISTLTAADIEPVSPPRQAPTPFNFFSHTAAEMEPVPTPRQAPAAPFDFFSHTAAETEPVSPPRQAPAAPLSFTTLTAAETEPISPSPQVITASAVTPLAMTSLAGVHTEPDAPMVSLPSNFADPFNLSTIMSQASTPVTPYEESERSVLPQTSSRRPELYTDSGFSPDQEHETLIPGTGSVRPGNAFFAANPHVPPPATQFPPRASSIRGISPERRLYSNKGVDTEVPTLVYADENAETSQMERTVTNGSRTPFAEVSNNTASSQRSIAEEGKPSFKRTKTSEQGTQTMVSADEMDTMLRNKNHTVVGDIPELGMRRSSEALPTLESAGLLKAPRRPGSSGSLRKNHMSPPPPLPVDHNIKIAAAGGKSPSTANSATSPSSAGTMGPPTIPASAQNKSSPRSKTPSIGPGSIRHGTATLQRSRISNSSSARPTLDVPSTRRSSVTSFASELDERFNISRANIYPDDMPPMTDPRMIQAITQTMIGEHLWKYTRKTGRSSEISGTRHRRFFWVHPYTRTLYWSEDDPSMHGAKQSKAKSVAIEAVRVISDDNAYPPGLHRKSLVVVTPGREIVFTAPTQARHETWFNALSYLLLRTGAEREDDVNDITGGLTREEVDEFNPQMPPRSSSRATGRTRMSLSSYNSRTTNGRSPHRKEYLTDVPTLSRRGQAQQQQRDRERREQERTGTLNRRPNSAKAADPGFNGQENGTTPGSMSSRFNTLSSVFKSPGSLRGSFSSQRSRSRTGDIRSKSALSNRRPEGSIYDASVIMEDSDSDDLGAAQMEIERREREREGHMENVRACCNGMSIPPH